MLNIAEIHHAAPGLELFENVPVILHNLKEKFSIVITFPYLSIKIFETVIKIVLL